MTRAGEGRLAARARARRTTARCRGFHGRGRAIPGDPPRSASTTPTPGACCAMLRCAASTGGGAGGGGARRRQHGYRRVCLCCLFSSLAPSASTGRWFLTNMLPVTTPPASLFPPQPGASPGARARRAESGAASAARRRQRGVGHQQRAPRDSLVARRLLRVPGTASRASSVRDARQPGGNMRRD